MLPLKIFLFRFRPSSHSSDYTIVVRFRSEREAEEAYHKLRRLIEEIDDEDVESYGIDWDPSEAYYYVRGDKVYFSVYTAGRLGPAEDTLSDAEEYDVYTNYQELTISVEVPRGLIFDSAMLIISKEEAEMLKTLKKNCGETKVAVEGDRQFFIFKYRGDGIYDEFSNELFLEGLSLKLSGKPYWKVHLDG